jgi:alpha-tubulin suppressor-like RCC1 family protein
MKVVSLDGVGVCRVSLLPEFTNLNQPCCIMISAHLRGYRLVRATLSLSRIYHVKPRSSYTHRAKLGRKERGGASNAGKVIEYVQLRDENFTAQALKHNLARIRHPDLLEPHILRSLSNVKITSIHASCCGCSCIALDVDGAAWLFGRNAPAALGVADIDVISENAPRRMTAQQLGAKGARFVHAACGRGHSLLVGSDGQVWTAGVNSAGQVRDPVRRVKRGINGEGM